MQGRGASLQQAQPQDWTLPPWALSGSLSAQEGRLGKGPVLLISSHTISLSSSVQKGFWLIFSPFRV